MFMPQLPALLLLLLGKVVASNVPSDDHFALLQSRQAPGSPVYECHESCGNAILGGEVQGYCTNSTWLDEYNDCLGCAFTYDIWQYYGQDVAAAGAACGLSTQAPSSSQPSSTAAPVTATTTTAESTTSETPSSLTTGASASSTAGSSTSAPATGHTTAPSAAGAGVNSTSSAPGASNTVTSVSGGAAGMPTGSLLGVGAVVVSSLMAMWHI